MRKRTEIPSINGKLLAGKINRAINTMVKNELLDRDGNIPYTTKINGYVCAIHGQDDENEDLRGTIDVQELDCMQEVYDDYDESTPIGYHEGVYLSAIQNNQSGVLIVPTMYSEVTIVQDPQTKKEYVIAYSHASQLQLDSHETVSVGVTETEKFNEDDDNSPDFDQLPPTGKAAHTKYAPGELIESITKNYNDDGGEEEAKEGNYLRKVTPEASKTMLADTYEESFDAKHKTLKIGNTEIKIDGDKGSVELNINGTTISIDKKGQRVAIGGSSTSTISITDSGDVVLGQASDNAVTYTQLASVLNQLCSLLSSALVATKLGPQPLSTAGAIGALPSQFSSFRSNKVMIAK